MTEKALNADYDPKTYWERHLRSRPALMATGHRQFSLAYNEAMYAIATERLQQALAAAGIDLTGKRVLDIGAGFGYFVQKYLDWGAERVTGVDLTEVSVQALRQQFPGHAFFQADISDPALSIPGPYDLVSAISMIFHIVDEARFRQALTNMARLVEPGGYLLIVDAFRPAWMPTARHAKLRDLSAYRPILEREGFTDLRLSPMYYLMGQTFVPVLGPFLLNRSWMIRWLAAHDRQRGAGPQPKPGWLNYLIARRSV